MDPKLSAKSVRTPGKAANADAGFLGFPAGWFAVGWSRELPPGAVLTRQFMGGDIVLFRTQTGEPCAVDPYCPHLGAHLGHGGSVQGNTLRCPFHGFHFDCSGRCVSVPYGTRPPPAAKLRTWPIRERHGVLFVYHDPASAPPNWEIPDLDTTAWTPLDCYQYSWRGHPQETTENSIDIGHFQFVHGYIRPISIRPVEVKGPYLCVAYRISRRTRIWPGYEISIPAEFTAHVHGLGYSLVEIEIPDFGLSLRNFIFATPTVADLIDIRIAVSIKDAGLAVRGYKLPALVRRGLLRMLARVQLGILRQDINQDRPIWEHKRHLARPVLALGDGPIPLYRRWARQFYPDPAAPELFPQGPGGESLPELPPT